MESRTLFSAGGFDPSFSGDGVNTFSPGGNFHVIAIDNRGSRTIVLGQTAPDDAPAYAANLIAVNASGNLDTSFSGDGVRPLPRVLQPSDVFIQPDSTLR